ncbi:MAG TPA: TMEM175 family protein [Gemmatimonadales bacterium]|nr:TMEM175 family protein [Gemmatimonadales bacterium]
MNKGRLEAFSDGVLAIVITIMVLEMRPPHEGAWASLSPLLPVFLSYVLSFLHLGIYWNNHHHLFQVCRHVDGRVLWANLHLLFWLSLVPFVTAWMGESRFDARPVALYGGVLLMAACAYYLLTRALLSVHGADSALARALGNDVKGKASVAVYVLAIAVSFLVPLVACALYLAVAIAWLIPDPRMEKVLAEQQA